MTKAKTKASGGIFTATLPTPLGEVTVAANENALTGLWFIGQKYYPATAAWQKRPDHPVFAQVQSWLAAYFAGQKDLPALPLAPRGTPFQQAVWQMLLRIPLGQTSTYGKLAAQLAQARGQASMSAQAVGGAVGHNPISLVIPCHRVLGGNGSLTGYAGGLDRKQALLRLEGALL